MRILYRAQQFCGNGVWGHSYNRRGRFIIENNADYSHKIIVIIKRGVIIAVLVISINILQEKIKFNKIT